LKTLIFDFDGTLIDSVPVYGGITKKFLDDNGISYGDDLIEAITPLGYAGTADYLIQLGAKQTREEIRDYYLERIIYYYSHVIPAKPHAAEAMAELKKKGYCLNVLTASPHFSMDPCIERLKLLEYFDNVWSCEDFGTTKGNPEIYKMAAEKLGVPVKDIYFFDDNIHSLLAAKEAGTHICGVYDEASKDVADDIKEICENYVTDLAEIPTLY